LRGYINSLFSQNGLDLANKKVYNKNDFSLTLPLLSFLKISLIAKAGAFLCPFSLPVNIPKNNNQHFVASNRF